MGRRAYTSEDRKILRALAARLRTAREAAGLTQQHVADHIGITRAGVAMFEGGNGSPSIPILLAWARATKSTVADLVGTL
ncbi:MAG TPA: helix-turn-helix transcriptional regulator [Burkholderiales bacterium]|nr:helix-turn-helix transcriptional regulator [Burkholderiales bacterium]